MAVITICSDFGAPKNKVSHCFHCSPSICHEVMGLDAMILVLWMLGFKPTFPLSCFTFIKRLFRSSLSAIRGVSSAYLRLVTSLSPCQSPWPLQLCFPRHVDTEIPEGQRLLHKSHHPSTRAMLKEAAHCLRPCSLHWDWGEVGPWLFWVLGPCLDLCNTSSTSRTLAGPWPPLPLSPSSHNLPK